MNNSICVVRDRQTSGAGGRRASSANEQNERTRKVHGSVRAKRTDSVAHPRPCGNAEFAGVDIAGVDNAAPCGKGGQCGSGQCRSGEMRVKMCNIVMTGKESMAY